MMSCGRQGPVYIGLPTTSMSCETPCRCRRATVSAIDSAERGYPAMPQIGCQCPPASAFLLVPISIPSQEFGNDAARGTTSAHTVRRARHTARRARSTFKGDFHFSLRREEVFPSRPDATKRHGSANAKRLRPSQTYETPPMAQIIEAQ